jgi:hypothetical protein
MTGTMTRNRVLGAPCSVRSVPLIALSQDEGFALRDRLGRGERVVMSLQLDTEILINVETASVVATLDGAGDD